MLAGIGLTAAFVRLSIVLTSRCRCYIPARLRTVRDLVPFAITSDSVTWTREQVAVAVKQVVMVQLGLPESAYTEDAHFVDDFGIDR